MHMIWLATVCGKLETRYRYSNTLGWHTFPLPALTGADQTRLSACAENLLLARAEAGGTLAALYNPEMMPETLRVAHQVNDDTIERIYADRPFRSDADRLNHLFGRYARIVDASDQEDVADHTEIETEDMDA